MFCNYYIKQAAAVLLLPVLEFCFVDSNIAGLCRGKGNGYCFNKRRASSRIFTDLDVYVSLTKILCIDCMRSWPIPDKHDRISHIPLRSTSIRHWKYLYVSDQIADSSLPCFHYKTFGHVKDCRLWLVVCTGNGTRAKFPPD